MSDPTIWDDGFKAPGSVTIATPYTDHGVPADVYISAGEGHSNFSRFLLQGSNGRNSGKYYFEVWALDPSNNRIFIGVSRDRSAVAGIANLLSTDAADVQAAVNSSAEIAAGRLNGTAF